MQLRRDGTRSGRWSSEGGPLGASIFPAQQSVMTGLTFLWVYGRSGQPEHQRTQRPRYGSCGYPRREATQLLAPSYVWRYWERGELRELWRADSAGPDGNRDGLHRATAGRADVAQRRAGAIACGVRSRSKTIPAARSLLRGVGVRAPTEWNRAQLARLCLVQRLPRRPLRRLPGRALPSSAGRARRRVLHQKQASRPGLRRGALVRARRAVLGSALEPP
jgi:hypothetical protein